jgi:hypothetical protein
MTTYKMVGFESDKRDAQGRLQEVNIGTIQANSMVEVALFVAMNFPQYYFGLNIVEVDASKKCPDFMCLAVKDYYERTGLGTDPVKLALDSFNNSIKFKNGFCTVSYDRDGMSRTPMKNLTIPCIGKEV